MDLVNAWSNTRRLAKAIAQAKLLRGQVMVVHTSTIHAESMTIRVSSIKCAQVLLVIILAWFSESSVLLKIHRSVHFYAFLVRIANHRGSSASSLFITDVVVGGLLLVRIVATTSCDEMVSTRASRMLAHSRSWALPIAIVQIASLVVVLLHLIHLDPVLDQDVVFNEIVVHWLHFFLVQALMHMRKLIPSIAHGVAGHRVVWCLLIRCSAAILWRKVGLAEGLADWGLVGIWELSRRREMVVGPFLEELRLLVLVLLRIVHLLVSRLLLHHIWVMVHLLCHVVFLTRAEIARDDDNIVHSCGRLKLVLKLIDLLVVWALGHALIWTESRSTHCRGHLVHLIDVLVTLVILAAALLMAIVGCWCRCTHLIGHLLEDMGRCLRACANLVLLVMTSTLPGRLIVVKWCRCDTLHMDAHSFWLF